MPVETHVIRWSCDRCPEHGNLPQLPGATMADVRDAIHRGHERRSAPCHDRHGLRHVRVVQDGKTIRFGALGAGELHPNDRRDDETCT